MAYNKEHGIVPKSVSRPVQESLRPEKEEDSDDLLVAEKSSPQEIKKLIRQLEKEMFEAVKRLEFEKAALLRDQINFLKDGSQPNKSSSNHGKKYRKKRKSIGPR
jgi:excinuclease ABC subunit B